LAAISKEGLASLYREVQAVLDETLSLGARAYALTPESPLFGALPELDSQAVLSVLMGLEERFGISIADDDVSADVFATLETLTALVARASADQ
jgi:acyl carrier protein